MLDMFGAFLEQKSHVISAVLKDPDAVITSVLEWKPALLSPSVGSTGEPCWTGR